MGEKNVRLFIKKSQFPDQRVAKIVASRAAAKSFSFSILIFLGEKIVKNNIFKNEKKSYQSALIYPPGR